MDETLLAEQRRYLFALCNRCMPSWLRRYYDPDDIVQEALITVWKQHGPIPTSLLTCIGRRAVINAIRHFNRKSRLPAVTLELDVPWPDHDDEPDYRAVAEAVLGAPFVAKLLSRSVGSTRSVAVYRARKRMAAVWAERGSWPASD